MKVLFFMVTDISAKKIVTHSAHQHTVASRCIVTRQWTWNVPHSVFQNTVDYTYAAEPVDPFLTNMLYIEHIVDFHTAVLKLRWKHRSASYIAVSHSEVQLLMN